ncbi:glycosyltransferase [Flammeovirga kamogawensis]|uniref:Glycosyltransferase n=1 Tax=Flammeovirga kamogawensis TaxID=373891 RepID=A0ABX8GS29_9BACT|nr:glycosyltransferase [Flammeovirga kamogawensis]MBB6461496.1 cellulose synthase/poly-beta-1,6-N-acetylglucosamine synthase-like glycosyltransferase [Flammeovirga kamogawensis]QWG06388.1 glycosyltransferase [Flammeovirga kamogawensis]TRX68217.1 glycosyltransferase [Flammeovirga kamogawensis]
MNPTVSILVAARNEEGTIRQCLESLTNQSVNNNVCIEIIIGNDSSTDLTTEIIAEFVSEYSFIQSFIVPKNITYNGKVNVLNYISDLACGHYYLFADADVVYPPSWVENMLISLKNADITTGVTVVEGATLWMKFQKLDWMLALNQIHILSKLGIPLTAMGNNMGVKSEKFVDIGGFRNIPFSVAEDFALFNTIVKNKGSFCQLFDVSVLAKTKGMTTYFEWLQQRWRWMQGAKKLSLFFKTLNYLNIIFYPILLILMLFYPIVGVVMLNIYVLKCCYLMYIQKKLKEKIHWRATFLFDFYHCISYCGLLIYGLRNPSVEWKNRVYKPE